MQTLTLIIAIIVVILTIGATVMIYRRTNSTIPRVLSALVAVVVVAVTAAAATLSTVAVQTKIAMTGMEAIEPTATILKTDKQMRDKIEAAVEAGLSGDGPKIESVRKNVEEVLRPYMTYRLSHAPDRFIIASAKTTLNILKSAKAKGPETCSKIMAGDVKTIQSFGVVDNSWLSEMIKADALDEVPVATDQEFALFVENVSVQQNWTISDLGSMKSPGNRMLCDYPIATMTAAMSLPEEQSAAMLRRLGYGAQAVTSK